MTVNETIKSTTEKWKAKVKEVSTLKYASKKDLEKIKDLEHQVDKAETVARVYFQCYEMLLNVKNAEVIHKYVQEQKK